MDVLRFLVSLGAIVLTLWNFFRNDNAKVDERIKKLELDNANTQERMTGMHVQFERQNDSNAERFRNMETQLGEVGRLREDMVGVKSELRHISEGYNKLDSKLDKLFDLIRSK